MAEIARRARVAFAQSRRDGAHAARLGPVADARDAGKPFTRAGWCSSSSTTAIGCSPRRATAGDALVARGQRSHRTFPDVRDRRRAARSAFIIDGEVIVNERAASRASRCSRSGGAFAPRGRGASGARAAVPFYAFDLLGFADSTACVAAQRAQGRVTSAAADDRAAALLEHVEQHGEAMFVEAERLGLEGVVGKRAASQYVSKRSQTGSR
jgi:hypothetical protein